DVGEGGVGERCVGGWGKGGRCWYTREDLTLHAARAAASEAAASAISPRVHCWCRNGGSNAGYRLTKAVPCHWTIAALYSCGAGWRTRTPASRLQGECSSR